MAIVYAGILLSTATASPPLFPLQTGGTQVGYIPANTLPIQSLGLVCTVSNGASLIYSVQVSGDNPEQAIVNWNNHAVVVNQTASIYSDIAQPVSAIRLNVTSWISGSVNLGIVQWP